MNRNTLITIGVIILIFGLALYGSIRGEIKENQLIHSHKYRVCYTRGRDYICNSTDKIEKLGDGGIRYVSALSGIQVEVHGTYVITEPTQTEK